MGLNLNLNLDKLPHIWQTVFAMVFVGVLSAGAVIGVTAKLSKDNARKLEAELITKQSVESLKTSVGDIQSTQQEILRSMASQEAQIKEYGQTLETEIRKIRSTFMFYVDNVEQMTEEQMRNIMRDVYGLGYENGKKKDMIP